MYILTIKHFHLKVLMDVRVVRTDLLLFKDPLSSTTVHEPSVGTGGLRVASVAPAEPRVSLFKIEETKPIRVPFYIKYIKLMNDNADYKMKFDNLQKININLRDNNEFLYQ